MLPPTRIVLLTILSLLVTTVLWAQPNHWVWRNFDMNDGLPASRVSCFLEDNLGFIWIGTSAGLCRFDGSQFTTFENQPGMVKSLRSDDITVLSLHPSGDILIGTRKGIARFSYSNGTFWNKQFDEFKLDDIVDFNYIRGFIGWNDGHTWIATLAGTIDWNENENTFTLLDSTFTTSRSGFANPFMMDEDSAGCWMATPAGMVHYDRKSGAMRGIPGHERRPDKIEAVRDVETWAFDLTGDLWYSVGKDSCFYKYSPSTGEEKKFYHLTVRGESKTPLSNTFLTCDNANRLWYSSWAGIIAIKDKMGTDDLHLPIDRKNELMIPYPMATAFFQAKNGDFWLGHGFGACVHSMSMEAVTRITLPRLTSAEVVDLNSIRSICPGPEPGDLFIGSDEGLYWQHEKSQTLTHHQIGGNIFENDVISLHKVGSEIYCCTRRGLFSFDPATDQFRKLNWMDEEFSETGVYKMIEYGDDLWFLCRYSRLYCYHKKTGKFDKFEPREGDKSAIPGNYMPFMELSDEGIVWLIGAECISWMDPADTIFHTSDFFGGQRKYGNTNVNSVLKMGDEIWFSTNYEGVYVIDCKHKTCKPLEHEEIQNLTSRVLLCTDPAGNTWMGSAKGVFIHSKGNPHIEPYLLERSLAMGERHLVGVNMPDGRIAVASNFEALVLDGGLRPDVLRIAPPVVSLVSSTDTVALFLDRDILFDSDRNHFSFQFSTPSATGISFVEYQYRIEGIDDQWIDAGRKNSAFYGNLSGGDYVVWVRARSGKGPWVQMIRPLKITISKKYYETIWFKSALALMLVFLLIVVVRRRKAIERAADRQKALKHFVEMKGIPSMGALQSDVINAVTNQLRFVWCMVVFKENEGHYVVAQSAATPQNLLDIGGINWAADADDIRKRLTQSGDNSVLVKPLSGDENQLGWIIAGGHKEDNTYTADAATVNDIASVAAAMVASSLNENEIKRKEELLAEVNALLSESQLVSLRAQMNPHFVFNCLNSIQESIVMKQYAEASLYLNKFSKLFRMVLQNSSRSLISLEDEINVLTLYLELEHMRFQRSFDYRIDADEDLDISDIQVPSMLIQPFVENALWHGLMHKPSDRKLVIRFYPVSDDVFICEVEDNGIGRKKAGEIKAERNKTISHESKGINISTDRLRLISLQQGKQAAVRFEDLYDADGNAAGTRVVFELSMYLN